MSGKFKFVEPSAKSAKQPASIALTNWALCFLCQEDDKDTLLVDPQRNKDESVKTSTYKSMADRLVEFQSYGKIPMNINLDRLDDGTGITNTLQVKGAKYHKNCYPQISRDRLLIAKKRHSKKHGESTEGPSPKKTKRSLDSSVGSGTPEDPICFNCEQFGGLMHAACTDSVDKSVKKYASITKNQKLLTKLAISDMHAVDAQ